MTQDEAERLARIVKLRAGYELVGKIGDLCDHILSGDHKRKIENAAYERAAEQFDRLCCVEASKTCRSLIQPAAQKGDGG